MNFTARFIVNYIMIKFKRIICFLLCAVIVAATIITGLVLYGNDRDGRKDELVVLTIWQIDSFEGGKGSRANFLQNVAENFYEEYGVYAKVTQMEHESVLINLQQGNVPDIVSYGACSYGLENYLIDGYQCWCYGSYCILSLNPSSDFGDVTAENTVINEGKNNFSRAAAMFAGLGAAPALPSTAAYVKLIDGEYQYLLGTQRDVFRLKTRNVSFSVKPVTEFNDLYQLVSVTTDVPARAKAAAQYIDYLLERSQNLSSVGMLGNSVGIYDDEMKALEGVRYDYKISSPMSKVTYEQIKLYENENQPDKIKMLLK